VTRPKPFFSILFLSITAIPEFAVTDLGLVETASRQVIDPVLSYQ
jgi:adenine deaminase